MGFSPEDYWSERSEPAWAFVELRTNALSLYLLVRVITMECSEVNVSLSSSWSLPMMSTTLHDLSLTPRSSLLCSLHLTCLLVNRSFLLPPELSASALTIQLSWHIFLTQSLMIEAITSSINQKCIIYKSSVLKTS